MQKDLESASDSRPTTLTAARLCLDRLATSAAEVVGMASMPTPRAKRSGGHAPSPGNARMPSMS
ncbi:MAG: hypothetical protein MZW92_27680 [Comamonadaceae bacterium]|nr:hypothetical protein [Comamonadaceae bacterium]